jgi:hypothetical protein
MMALGTVTYFEVAIGTADTLVAAADPHRQAIIVSNPTANQLYVAFGQVATAGQSFLIAAAGAPVRLTADDIGALIQGTIHAIFATAAGHASGFLGRDI